jgi:hypothetical protein
MEVFLLGEKMPKKLTVKNVKQFLSGYDVQHLYTVQQILAWFNLERKLERVVWAILKRHELDCKRAAELATTLGESQPPKVETHETVMHEKPVKSGVIPDLPPLTVVVGTCPKCGSNLMGQALGVCSKVTKQPTFYKECSACKYYAEIWKYRNKFKEVEGG